MTYTSVRDEDDELMLDLVVDWAYLESQMDQGDLLDGADFWHAVAKMCWAADIGAGEHPEEERVLSGLFPEYRLPALLPPPRRPNVVGLAVGGTCFRDHKIETEADLRIEGGRVRCRTCRREDDRKSKAKASALAKQTSNETGEMAA